ncbi:hypothetical protein BT96DRAFT_938932 [Gymnopus androsaceus JB14]|uniref:Uncharacterized protein n=1 Tax=Gymnopus androsaceus JB14 TaxID=1447944 RepID=A0A6A4HTI7_9AGAR|nr:hypothetical protein BT96DRAFT_938932 [Gymnopus androsaceus JB14]
MATCNVEVESKTLSWVSFPDDSFPDDKHLAGESPSGILTHAKFGELNVGLFKKTIMPVEQVLKDANIKKDDINESSSSYSQGAKEPSQGINHDEAIVYGANRVVFSLEGTADVVLVHPLIMIELIPCNIAIPSYREISNQKHSAILRAQKEDEGAGPE